MTKPQQPELRRSSRGATDTDSAKAHVTSVSGKERRIGPVPPGNRAGWEARDEPGGNQHDDVYPI